MVATSDGLPAVFPSGTCWLQRFASVPVLETCSRSAVDDREAPAEYDAFYGAYDPRESARCTALADQLGVTCTSGSDWHGPDAANAQPGVDLPDECSTALLAWLGQEPVGAQDAPIGVSLRKWPAILSRRTRAAHQASARDSGSARRKLVAIHLVDGQCAGYRRERQATAAHLAA